MENLLRWTVTVLFGVSFGAYGYFLLAQYTRRTKAVSHLLHLAMSVAMILMVWGVGTSPATTGVRIGFLAAGAWFAGVATRASWAGGERLTNCYYAVMMATMAWMYASMNANLTGRSGQTTGHALSTPPVRSVTPSTICFARAWRADSSATIFRTWERSSGPRDIVL